MTTEESMFVRNQRWTRRSTRVEIDGRLTAVGEIGHGLHATYANHHCRCAPCTDANRLHHRDQRARRRKDLIIRNGRLFHPQVQRHNSSAYSNWGCRCRTCTDDFAAMKRFKRAQT